MDKDRVKNGDLKKNNKQPVGMKSCPKCSKIVEYCDRTHEILDYQLEPLHLVLEKVKTFYHFDRQFKDHKTGKKGIYLTPEEISCIEGTIKTVLWSISETSSQLGTMNILL